MFRRVTSLDLTYMIKNHMLMSKKRSKQNSRDTEKRKKKDVLF